jgi:hypothetical protein
MSVMTTAGADVVAASGEDAEQLENLQFVLGEGPTGDAFRSRQPVLVHDLATGGRHWLQFAPAARKLGVEAAYAFPLQLGAVRVGVLTAYGTAERSLEPGQVVEGLRLAERARDVLLDTQEHEREPAPGAAHALPLRTQVYQAQGMLMVALGVDLADALARLRATAYAEDIDLNELAAEIVSGRRPMPTKDG